MLYRRLGRSGLRLSTLSLGSWVTYHNQVDTRTAVEMMAAAFDAGINFFDNAEAYAGGQSEVVMGQALKQLAWPRLNYVVSTKFFWGLASFCLRSRASRWCSGSCSGKPATPAPCGRTPCSAASL